MRIGLGREAAPMIEYAQLRALVGGWPKYPGCQRVRRAPLVTAAFPGDFNLSSTEHHWVRELGGYLDWDRDYVFTTIQSCVRLGDFALLPTAAGARYLGVFEMGDLSGEIALRARPDYRELLRWQIAELVRLLGVLGIPPERIQASYSAGGRIADLTGGRYRFDGEIPADALSRDAFLEAGVPETNVTPDATRATLLALHVHRATPWGYRSEIHVDIGTPGCPRLIDVATAEYFLWRPRFSGTEPRREDIVGLAPLETGATGIGVGLERLTMVSNGLARIHDVDYLRPFYEGLRDALGGELRPDDYVAGESLRALHRIQADLRSHPEVAGQRGEDGSVRLSVRRRKKLARLKRSVPARLDAARLERLLVAHSDSQPWHEDLTAAIEATIAQLVDYRGSQARDLIRRD
jgi:hypothetical protein